MRQSHLQEVFISARIWIERWINAVKAGKSQDVLLIEWVEEKSIWNRKSPDRHAILLIDLGPYAWTADISPIAFIFYPPFKLK